MMIESWYDNINWGYLTSMVLLLSFIVVMIFMISPETITSLPMIEPIIEANEKRVDMLERYEMIARESTDCNELKQIQLDLLDYGVNPDSWFPRFSDKTMKLAQDRYEILCQ